MRSVGLRLGLTLLAAAAMPGCTAPEQSIVGHLPDPLFRGARSRVRPRTTAVVSPARPPRVAPRAVQRLPEGVDLAGRARRSWKYIVIHHSATDTGSARSFDGFHRKVNGWDEMGYHFVIGNGQGTPDGAIEVGSRWVKQKHGAHCKTLDNRYNEQGIGICLVGNFEESAPTPAQMASLQRLVSHLMADYAIPAANVCGHGGVTQRTACPGRNFPLESFKSQLNRMALRPF